MSDLTGPAAALAIGWGAIYIMGATLAAVGVTLILVGWAG